MQDATLETPAVARVVGDEPRAIQVRVIRVLRGNAAGCDEDACFQHAANHCPHPEPARFKDHPQRRGKAAAFDEFHIYPVEI